MDMVYYRTIGDNVRNFRIKRGMTQEGLAEKAQLSTKVIQKVEAGQSGIRMDTFIKLSVALNVSMDVLAGVQEMDEKKMYQQAAFYMLAEDKSDEEIEYAVQLVRMIFYLKKEYLG